MFAIIKRIRPVEIKTVGIGISHKGIFQILIEMLGTRIIQSAINF